LENIWLKCTSKTSDFTYYRYIKKLKTPHINKLNKKDLNSIYNWQKTIIFNCSYYTDNSFPMPLENDDIDFAMLIFLIFSDEDTEIITNENDLNKINLKLIA
jgi:hypothetical protein